MHMSSFYPLFLRDAADLWAMKAERERYFLRNSIGLRTSRSLRTANSLSKGFENHPGSHLRGVEDISPGSHKSFRPQPIVRAAAYTTSSKWKLAS